ncbi:hypothetical protein [Chromobacterium amazonense]
MSHPVVTVKNHSSHHVYIEVDPNWDDQVLLAGADQSHKKTGPRGLMPFT